MESVFVSFGSQQNEPAEHIFHCTCVCVCVTYTNTSAFDIFLVCNSSPFVRIWAEKFVFALEKSIKARKLKSFGWKMEFLFFFWNICGWISGGACGLLRSIQLNYRKTRKKIRRTKTKTYCQWLVRLSTVFSLVAVEVVYSIVAVMAVIVAVVVFVGIVDFVADCSSTFLRGYVYCDIWMVIISIWRVRICFTISETNNTRFNALNRLSNNRFGVYDTNNTNQTK